jgi:hypothetical protein
VLAHASRLTGAPHGERLFLDFGLVLGRAEPPVCHLIPGGFAPGVPSSDSHSAAFTLVILEFGSEIHGHRPSLEDTILT